MSSHFQFDFLNFQVDQVDFFLTHLSRISQPIIMFWVAVARQTPANHDKSESARNVCAYASGNDVMMFMMMLKKWIWERWKACWSNFLALRKRSRLGLRQANDWIFETILRIIIAKMEIVMEIL